MKKQLQLIVIILLSFVYNSSYSQLFFEDFENTNGPNPLPSTNWNLPSGNWAVFDNGVNASPSVNWNTNANTNFICQGTSAYMNRSNIGQGNTAEDYLATPAILVPSNGTLTFNGKSLVVGDTGTIYQIKVKMATTGAQNDPNGYDIIAQWDEAQMTVDCTDYILDLSAYTGLEIYIAFVMTNTQLGVSLSGDRWIVDNVQVQGITQSCPAPTNLFANTILQNNDTIITWTEMGTATQWEIQLDGTPFMTTTSNSVVIPGLFSGVHVVSVRAICSPNDFSDWSSFTFLIDPCLPPTSYNVNGITNTSATLNWNPSGPNVYQYEILVLQQSAGLPNGNAFGVYVTGTTYIATGLNSNTPYNFFIRPICNQGMLSPWSNGISFITNQDPITSPVCGGQFIDNGGISANYANGSDDTYTICPTNPGDLVTVAFSIFDTEANWDGLLVYDGISTTAPQIASTNGVGNGPTANLPGSFWGNTIPGPFTSSSSDGCLTFRFVSDASVSRPGWVATVSCGPASTCPAISSVSVIPTTNSTATVSWTENGSATQWEVVINGGAGVLTNSNPYTITNLIPGSVNVVAVRAICSNTDMSYWTSYSFIMPVCTSPIQISIADITETTAVISWENSNNSTSWEIAIQPQNITSIPTSGVVTNTNSYLATGLISGTAYKVYVRANCGGSNFGTWSTVVYFNTLLAPIICGGQFIDNGGASNYANSSDNTYVICPTTAGEVVNVVFTAFDTEANWDGLYVFNGNSINSPQIASTNSASNVPGGLAGAFWGNISPGTFTSTSLDGCLTFRFRSDASVNKPGWVANIICGEPLPVTCSVPFNIAVSNITANSGIITWSTQSSTFQTAQSEIIILPSGSPAPTSSSAGTILLSNTHTTNGLLTSTSYDIYIRAICLGNNITEWSSPVTFTTLQYYAPLVANTSLYNPAQLVENVLASNPCIDISNVTSSTGTNFGSVNGIGYFTNTNPSFPLSSGIVLSSGNALAVSGPNTTTISDGNSNWPGDSDLETIITTATGQAMNSKNATKLEFDFTTLNEFMSFNFLFASEEYGTFQCAFSDAFAFLLTDLTTGITTNLAVVPGTTTPVSVVTIRDQEFNTGCASVNPGYFDIYNNTINSAINFNGQTTVMTASSALIPNHPYHIKLVVSDRQDNILDSAVFIEAGAFTAGPPECNDKMKLIAFVDSNNNGTKDSGENDFNYGAFTIEQNNNGVINNIVSPIGTYIIYDSNPSNVYDLGFQINAEYAPYYTLTPVNYNDVNIELGSGLQTIYFPVTLTQGYNDVTVSISPLSPPRPGFSYTNKIVYRNLGVTATSGTINFVKDPATTIVSIGQAGTVSNANGFSYDFVNLQPYESRSFNVIMSVPTIPTVNLGDVLTNSATISATANDINLTNNSFVNSQIVVGSYDPNDITEAHGGKIQFNQFTVNDYLYYTIRFQNTGTANAINVRLENVLDTQLDASSIRMVSSSHNYIMERVNNQLVWKFDLINLVGALQNEELSKGYVTYKIKVKPGFAIGDIIPNTADIYFDFNPAITTNTFNTEFVSTLANANFELGNFALYPNPAQNNVTVNIQNTTETIDSITITDVLGKTIRKVNAISDKVINLDVSDLAQGVYMIEIKTESNLKQIKKLIKE